MIQSTVYSMQTTKHSMQNYNAYYAYITTSKLRIALHKLHYTTLHYVPFLDFYCISYKLSKCHVCTILMLHAYVKMCTH